MATGTTNAIPTYGETTEYVSNKIKQYTDDLTATTTNTSAHFVVRFDNKLQTYNGWTSPFSKTFESNTSLAILGAGAMGNINNMKFYIVDKSSQSVLAMTPPFLLITGGTQLPLLASTAETATVNVCYNTSATTLGTTVIRGPIGSGVLLWFNKDDKKYLVL